METLVSSSDDDFHMQLPSESMNHVRTVMHMDKQPEKLNYDEMYANACINKLVYNHQQTDLFKKGQNIGKVNYKVKLDTIELIDLKLRNQGTRF